MHIGKILPQRKNYQTDRITVHTHDETTNLKIARIQAYKINSVVANKISNYSTLQCKH